MPTHPSPLRAPLPPRHDGCVRRAFLAVLAASSTFALAQAPTTAPPSSAVEKAPDSATFANLAGSFRVQVPPSWRQLAPGELKALTAAVPQLPHDVRQNVPHMFYAVGPVEAWLRGEFDGEYLYVVEQDAEWHLDGDLKARLQQMWSDKGATDGQRYEVLSAERVSLGPEAHPAVVADRRITPTDGRALRSLDVHVPTGGREVTLCWTCREDAFDQKRGEFLARAHTIALARKSRGEQKLSDRLWTPLLAGGVVGIILLVLYRKARRPPV